MSLPEIAAKIEASGLTARIWNECRVYVKKGSKDLGYLVKGDNGTTGTCKGIHTRQGEVAEILRG